MIVGWIIVLAALVYAVGPAVWHAVARPAAQERRCEPLQAPMVRTFRVDLPDGGDYRFRLTQDGLRAERVHPPYDWAEQGEV